MVSGVKAIADLIPLAQSAQLAGHGFKVATKKDKTIKDIVGLGVTNIVGASLIQTTAGITGGLI